MQYAHLTDIQQELTANCETMKTELEKIQNMLKNANGPDQQLLDKQVPLIKGRLKIMKTAIKLSLIFIKGHDY